MSIKTNYNFNGIEVKDAIIKVERIFGSSKEGWNSLVYVYNVVTETTTDVEGNEVTQDVRKKIDEFNFTAAFKEDERGYVSLYNGLLAKYGGVSV